MSNSEQELMKLIGLTSNDLEKKNIQIKNEQKKSFLPSTLALISLTGTSIVVGFFATLAMAKKRDGETLNKALMQRKGMSESGVKLAFRALGWGTFYALSGFSIISFSIYQLTKHKINKKEN